MDVSPIQRLAMTANQAAPPAETVRPALAVPPAAQADPARAERQAEDRASSMEATSRVVVAWHAGSVGYVTRVVDQHTGQVVMQTPPQQVLEMVQKIIERLEEVGR